MKQDEYIQGKKNAIAKRLERQRWLQQKLDKYNEEMDTLRDVIASDKEVLEKLESLERLQKELEFNLSDTLEKMAGLQADSLKLAMLRYQDIRMTLDATQAEMRTLFYGK